MELQVMEFYFEGKGYYIHPDTRYGVNEIYNNGYCLKLPDGRFLEVISWVECMPPYPIDFRVITRREVKKGWVLVKAVEE